ncbi:uncharacterized protein B0H18DRAFT_1116585 [Fomitopsis serialis]|uniref:uncharacterized protein n=1 Tax=Fomitopsis serialis TaxID=139415 RepID=UPI0020082679|nr:uncharacterized protein B0H18DRAFT_1116585 [Neoantrodia serialis]KAH9930878.1 hypothetical protein B0H18DRAFT_1116585 [Neoantrodia serialis]
MARSVHRSPDVDDEGSEPEHSDPPAPAQARRQRPNSARPHVADEALFRIDGRPARFYLYKVGFGALTEGQAEALANKILAHGGELADEEEEADTIIVQYVGVDHLRRIYWDSRTVWVEEVAFVEICINSKKYVENLHTPIRKGMGGQPTGASRVAFTAEDDRHLAEYLAFVVPDAAEGGRGGKEIYRRLVESAKEFRHREWATRHTMWSWRERYNKRKDKFDPVIDRLVADNPPRRDGKGLYERSRYYKSGGPQVDDPGSGSDEGDRVEGEGDVNAVQEQAQNQPRGSGQNVRPPRQRQSEPAIQRRQSESVSPPPRKRARHTDVAQRRLSSVEQARASQQPRPSPYGPRSTRRSLLATSREDIPFEVSSAEEDDMRIEPFNVDPDRLFGGDARPGPEDAGPSGAQRSSRPLSPSRRPNTHLAQKTRVPTKPISQTAQRGAASRPAKPGPSQVPMSSQATLVGAASQARQLPAPPSTWGGPTQVAREEEEMADEEAAAPGPSRTQQRPLAKRLDVEEELWPQEAPKRRIPAPAPWVAAAVALAGAERAGKRKRIGAVSRASVSGVFSSAEVPRSTQAKKPADPRTVARDDAAAAGSSGERQDERDLSYEGDVQGSSRKTVDHGDGGQLRTIVETQEGDDDDRHVEDLLALSTYTTSVANASARHTFEAVEEGLESDDERAQRTLLGGSGLFGPNTSASNRDHGMQLPMRDADLYEEASKPAHRTSDLPHAQRSSARPSIRPMNRPLPATPVPPGALGRTISLGSETDPIPVPGTRAREEKVRRQEQLKKTPYTPPSGTRAAQAAETYELRSRQISRPVRTTYRR